MSSTADVQVDGLANRQRLRTLRNALLGVVVAGLATTVSLGHPLLAATATPLGGLAAGLLQGGGLRGGALVGALTGLLTTGLVLALGFAATGGGPLGLLGVDFVPATDVLLFTVVVVVAALLFLGAGCLVGGLAGAVLRDRVVDRRQ